MSRLLAVEWYFFDALQYPFECYLASTVSNYLCDHRSASENRLDIFVSANEPSNSGPVAALNGDECSGVEDQCHLGSALRT